jgi:hypothetical protein
MSYRAIPNALWLLAAFVSLGIAVLAILAPLPILQGWAVAFVWATMIPAGSLALLLIHRLTGGEWGEALAPVLEPAAKAILPVALLSIPVLIFSGSIYRWERASESRDFLLRFYLSPPFFAFRAVLALSFWSAFAWIGALRSSPPSAAIGLIGMAIVTNVVPVDWVISTQPGFTSSGFGFGFVVEQMLAALAFCALLAPQGDNPKECRDLAAMIAAALLGTVYFVYVQFAIIWYGNLPQSTIWYEIRAAGRWPVIGSISLALGAILPFLALLHRSVRENTGWLRMIGAGISAAVALHAIWLMVPSFGLRALGPAVLSIIAMIALLAMWLSWHGLGWKNPDRTADGFAAKHG